MIKLFIVLWYSIGSFGGLILLLKIYPETRSRDLLFLFTIGGIGGLITFIIGLIFLKDKNRIKGVKNKYRIKQYEFNGNTWFKVQKKLGFLPFWYNFNNINGDITGIYDTYNEALRAIQENAAKTKITYHNVNL